MFVSKFDLLKGYWRDHPSKNHPTVQLTSKFTVVFSRVIFEGLIKSRVPHASERIACEGLVHTSLDCV